MYNSINNNFNEPAIKTHAFTNQQVKKQQKNKLVTLIDMQSKLSICNNHEPVLLHSYKFSFRFFLNVFKYIIKLGGRWKCEVHSK